MAKQYLIVAWDDLHNVEGEKVSATQERSFTYQGKTYVLDLTDEHAATFDESMQRLMEAAHDSYKAGDKRKSQTANAIQDAETGEVTVLDPKSHAKMNPPKGKKYRSPNAIPQDVAIANPDRRRMVRAWGIPRSLANATGKVSYDCQQAFMKAHNIADINEPISEQQALEAVGA